MHNFLYIGHEITLVVSAAEDLHQLSDDNNHDKNNNIMPTISRLVGQCARTGTSLRQQWIYTSSIWTYYQCHYISPGTPFSNMTGTPFTNMTGTPFTNMAGTHFTNMV